MLRHLNEKYFSYRAQAVADAQARAPKHADLIRTTEFLRLAYAFACSLLCALVFWVLTVGAVARYGGVALWPVAFAALALVPTAICAAIARSLAAAKRTGRSA
jgi:hypothetical protein